MKLNKKVFAVVMGLAITASGSAFAATADSFTDVPKDHWSYQALDYLAKEGVIEGMGDSTFQGGRSMTRYEVASIVAKAMQKGNLGIADSAVLEKLEKEYGGELETLKKQVDENTKQIAENKKGIERVNLHGFIRTQYDYDKNTTAETLDHGNDRFYMNLYGDFKVNDNWTARFQSETNRRYNDGHQRGETGFNSYGQKTWSGHDGNLQRIWVDGWFPKSQSWVSIGRSWRGLGNQNILFGNESDGVQFGMPIKGTGLTASGFYMASTGSGTQEAIYGVGTWGQIGHRAGINMAYAKSSKSKGDTYASSEIDYYTVNRSNVVVPVYKSDQTVGRDYGFVLSGYVDVAKDLRFLADYVKTNADVQNKSLGLRLNYRNTDLQKPGTYSLYTRYIHYGANGNIAGDDEWGSTPSGTKGWIFGVKYVPCKNVEWETLYSHQTRGYDQSWEYNRNLLRSQVDFHF